MCRYTACGGILDSDHSSCQEDFLLISLVLGILSKMGLCDSLLSKFFLMLTLTQIWPEEPSWGQFLCPLTMFPLNTSCFRLTCTSLPWIWNHPLSPKSQVSCSGMFGELCDRTSALPPLRYHHFQGLPPFRVRECIGKWAAFKTHHHALLLWKSERAWVVGISVFSVLPYKKGRGYFPLTLLK